MEYTLPASPVAKVAAVAASKQTENDREAEMLCDVSRWQSAAFYVPANSDTVRKVNEIEPKLVDNCDGLKTKTGCFDLQITDVMTGFWPSPDGALPKEEPACGFRNERCDYTMIIIAGALVSVLVCGAVTTLIMIRVWYVVAVLVIVAFFVLFCYPRPLLPHPKIYMTLKSGSATNSRMAEENLHFGGV
ncbi:hypothetical protein TELCIR_21918 [Teladorsagia circumcincta]|uniref:Uncharacterized protein n=1 Tax=Teladorsagia circumcincta TaxID=45464 RepID=A0A2G9TGN2_TELCI|nr:hypothetical protein TELCIR_21918 [Teladorsagia circumcincta]